METLPSLCWSSVLLALSIFIDNVSHGRRLLLPRTSVILHHTLFVFQVFILFSAVKYFTSRTERFPTKPRRWHKIFTGIVYFFFNFFFSIIQVIICKIWCFPLCGIPKLWGFSVFSLCFSCFYFSCLTATNNGQVTKKVINIWGPSTSNYIK